LGDVEDVRPHLWTSQVAVAPLQIARGIQNKVLEALSVGSAVVSSPQAMQGLEVQAGVHLYCAGTAAEWTASLDVLMSDPCKRSSLGDAGRDFVRQRHRWEACLRPLEELLGTARETAAARACALPIACNT
jgi:hypothetical protein